MTNNLLTPITSRTIVSDNEKALAQGNWVKFICGASNHDLPFISDLCAIYSAAGVHCIDLAADSAVVHAAREGIEWVNTRLGIKPWLMVSVSDGEDIHFRKAWFNPQKCPPACDRPCERICPAEAINKKEGVVNSRCYGCGRCLPICPVGLISEFSQLLEISKLGSLIAELKPDAVEIHTDLGRSQAFEQILQAITSSNTSLKRVAVSCGLKEKCYSIEALATELWQRHNCLRNYDQKPIWQLDGRPMSGDIGAGTSHAAIKLFREIRPLAPPGPLQLAGGTNASTFRNLPLRHKPAGIAFGGMARKLIQPWLLEAQTKKINLREWPEGWRQALSLAKELINPWLGYKT